MKLRIDTDEHRSKRGLSFCVFLCLIVFVIFLGACSELEKPQTKPYIAQNNPPPEKSEFRWSNGKTPKSFDPAHAAAPPETDIVRAIFEGLTEIEPKTLVAIPAVAEDWTASNDSKTWTFNLRKEARWSNGEPVKAEDFVRSWTRLAKMGEEVSHHKLLNNIVGMQELKPEFPLNAEKPTAEIIFQTNVNQSVPLIKKPETPIPINPPPGSNTNQNVPLIKTDDKDKKKEKKEKKFGVEAVDENTLKVYLIKPDKDFPKLVAHPIFYPVYGDGEKLDADKLRADITTNGAFRIFSIGQDGITLDRSESYWNVANVELERVRFVPSENAENALEEYRAGNLDAVTNADFQPLALKLLTPFDDFTRTTHNAINFYEFNQKKPPFNDKRIREALAIGIERERLTDGDMKGATRPALSFSPFEEKQDKRLAQNVNRAQNLFSAAGFEKGEDFPTIKLLINRNDTQQRIAKSIAKMWKENLGIETEIIVKENNEIDELRKTGSFDLVRRGEVLPTVDQTANLLAIFTPKKLVAEKIEKKSPLLVENKEKKSAGSLPEILNPSSENTNTVEENLTGENTTKTYFIDYLDENSDAILTEDEAMTELPAIPLYFPTTYSLVKPYISGFEINTLDAPSLKNVKIDSNWQPSKGDKQS